MEPTPTHVLIIDDHPLITEAYKSALYVEEESEKYKFFIDVCHNCSDADAIIRNAAASKKTIALVFLDISLPPSEDGKILSGEDLGIKLRELMPATKIIVSTTFSDNYRIHNIVKSINPEGFLVKNDINPTELIEAIHTVLDGEPYFTKTVLSVFRKNIASSHYLDNTDRRILYELSIGTKMKDLPDILPLSIAGIEKRKRNLKVIFDIKNNSDRDLILLAKEKGFI